MTAAEKGRIVNSVRVASPAFDPEPADDTDSYAQKVFWRR